MSFWIAEDKVPIEQTQTAISATNGLNYSPGQVIHIDVPPTTKYFKPSDCFLQFDCKIETPNEGNNKTRLQLDAEIGAQSLIRNLRIYTSPESGGTLLEEIQDYNAMVAIKYSYDTDDSKKALRAISGEGITINKPETKGTQGSNRSSCADITTNPFFKTSRFDDDETSASDTNKIDTTFTNASRMTAKCCLPIHSGIFDSERVWPNVLTGLRIEIELEEADVVVRQLESVLLNNKFRLNPIFDSVNGSITAGKSDLGQNGSTQSIFLAPDNSQKFPYQCPFVVGEYINLASNNGTVYASWNTSDADAFEEYPRIAKIEFDENASGGDGLVKLTFDKPMEQIAAHTFSHVNEASHPNGGVHLFSVSVSPLSGCQVAAGYTFAASYEISNVELIVQELDIGKTEENRMMSQMKEGGVMVMDILSVQNYKYSQLKSDIVANIRLPLDFSRARSIVCLPTDSNSYNLAKRLTADDTYQVLANDSCDVRSFSTRTGLVGISDHLTNYQFLYDGRLQPSRQVPCSKISSKKSIDAQPLIETEKALVQADIPVKSFASFNENFVIARALSLNSGVYDCRGRDFNLQVNYQGSAPTKNKLWKNFVWHLRRISIKGDSVSVEM